MDADIEPMVELIATLDDMAVTGPDAEGLIWLTFTPSSGEAMSINMGPPEGVTGRAALAAGQARAAMEGRYQGGSR